MGMVIDVVGEEEVGVSEMEVPDGMKGLDPVEVEDTRGNPSGTQGKSGDMEGNEEEEEEEEEANIHPI